MTTEAVRKNPANVQAILNYCKTKRPDCLAHVEEILRENAQNPPSRTSQGLVLLLLLGFEAGRKFQTLFPTTPLGGGNHYLEGPFRHWLLKDMGGITVVEFYDAAERATTTFNKKALEERIRQLDAAGYDAGMERAALKDLRELVGE